MLNFIDFLDFSSFCHFCGEILRGWGIMVWNGYKTLGKKFKWRFFCFLPETAWGFIRNRFCFFCLEFVSKCRYKKEPRVDSWVKLLRQSIIYFIVWQCTVRHYHGSLGHDERQSAHVAFLNGTAPVIVATVAFGMGIDKPDIRRSGHYVRYERHINLSFVEPNRSFNTGY